MFVRFFVLNQPRARSKGWVETKHPAFEEGCGFHFQHGAQRIMSEASNPASTLPKVGPKQKKPAFEEG